MKGWTAVRILLVRLRFVALVAGAALAAAFADDLSALAHGIFARTGVPQARVAAAASFAEYVCPMHPDSVHTTPGSCPACGMPLVLRAAAPAQSADESGLELSPEQRRQGGIAVVQVQRRELVRELSALATIEPDERRVAHVVARLKGLVQSVLVAAPGDRVQKGDLLAVLEVPDLFSYGRELIKGRRDGDAQYLLAQQRLLLMGLTRLQVARLEKTGNPMRLEVHAPFSGTVLVKSVVPGDLVTEGTPLFTVADLSRVWAVARPYENEAALLVPGMEVEVEPAGEPGRTHRGRISSSEASVDRDTRTLSVRAELDNLDGALKPGMSARAIFRVPLKESGQPPLVVPVSAVVDTGGQQLVFRELTPGSYEPLAVAVSARAGDLCALASGPSEGDRVVAQGAFLLWAESRLKGRPAREPGAALAPEVAP